MTTDKPTRVHRTGAPLLPPTIAYVVLTLAALVLPGLLAGVRPWTSDTALLDFYRHHAAAAHALAFFTIGAAVPLAVLVAVATTRLRTLGIDVPGRIIAQVGGTAAVAMLSLAGVATLAVTQHHLADSATAVRLVAGISYAAGGPAYVVFSGLLIAGISISGLAGGVLSRPIGWAGIVIAGVCEVASLAAAFDALSVLLPVGRFTGLAWLLVLGVTLPTTRRELRDRRRIVRAADGAAADPAS